MIKDVFVCVFLAFNSNAELDSGDKYYALMESTEPGISIQSSRSDFLVDSFTDQNNQLIIPKENQFIIPADRLQAQVKAGEIVLSDLTRQTFPIDRTREEVESQHQERLKALEEIQRAQSGQEAQICELKIM